MIRHLVKTRSISTQAELRRLLLQEGITVTQATLSRDIKLLGIVKRFDEHGGQRYFLPEEQGVSNISYSKLTRILRDSMVNMQTAQHLVVLRTLPGHAHAVSSHFDGLGWSDLVATIAGDDTLLLIAKDAAVAHILEQRILALLE